MKALGSYFGILTKGEPELDPYVDVNLAVSHLSEAINYFSKSPLGNRYMVSTMIEDRDFLRK